MRFDVRKMSRRRSRPAPEPPSTPGAPTCCFCGFSEDDEVEYGKLWNQDGIVTHYYCLLLSSNMEQNGNDNEGILGFMPTDIQKELRRGKRLFCSYCSRAGATLGCCNTRCKRVFHLPCGLRAGSLHQFFGEFRSFCINHRIKQEIDEHIKGEAAAAGVVTCYICYEEVSPQNTVRTLWAPCCRKNAWFHRKCVQRLALSAGYFFKCPLCNNKKEFQKAMLEHGIFIPHQDASWELVPNAYQELLHRHNRCDASECLCPKGRSHTSVNAKWELVLCRLCGSQGVHKACGRLKWANSVWECAECVGMLRKTIEDTPHGADQTTKATSEISHDESSSDSNISVGGNPSPLPITERPDSPPPITSSVKLRPGPRSFKLQQAMQNAKSAEIARIAASNISVSENRDIPLPSGSDINRDDVCSEKCESEVSGAGSSLVCKDSSLSESICTERNCSILEESSISVEEAGVKSIERKRPVAEVIMIESDDEVEIINITPRNILTTNDGTKIPIHCLPQVSAESHKAEGDVKIAEATYSDLSKPSSCQSKRSSAANGSVPLDTSSLSQSYRPNSISTATLQLHSSNPNIAKCPVTSGNTLGTETQVSFLNREDSDLILASGVVQNNSVMNLKITNVTSLRHEDFSNSFDEPNVFCGSGSRSHLNGGQLVHIIQATDLTSGSPKSSTTAIDLSMSGNKKSNTKRKSKEYAEKNLPTLLNKEAVESRKKARVCESRNSGCAPQNASISWNITLDDVNRTIPILMGSVPTTCSSDTNRFQQSTTTLEPNDLKTGGNEGLGPIYTPEIHGRNGIRKNPPGTGLASSVQKKTLDSINNVNGESVRPPPVVSPVNFTRVPKITKTYSAKRLSIKSTGLNSSNVHGTTYTVQQSTVNGPQNLLETASAMFKPQTLAQRTPSSSKSVAQTPHAVYQSPANINIEMKRYNMSGGTLETNISTTAVPCVDSLSKNCEGTLTGSNRNQPNTNDVSKTNHSIIQLANGIPFRSSCDGDAGSSLPAGAGFAHQASSRNSVHESAEPITLIDSNAASGTSQTDDDNSSISTCVSANSTNIRTHSSPPTKRQFCDKPRLIPDNVPLRNLNFRVLDSGNIQIIVCDTFTLNINADTANPRNNQNPAGPSSSVRKQKLLSPRPLLKFVGIENDRVINISEECGLPHIRRCTSSKKSVEYPIISGSESDDSGLSSSDATIEHSNVKVCSAVEIKREIGTKLSRTKTEDQRHRENDCKQKMNSVTEISSTNEATVRECFQSIGKNSLCLGHKENLFKEKRIGPAFSNNGKNLKNLLEKDANIITIEKRDGFSKNLKQTLAKQVKDENKTRSVSSIDFCSKSLNCMNDKSKEKLRNGLNRVSKCLMKSLDDSSALNLPNDCYTSSKNITNGISELDCNIKDSDANVQDSSKNDGSNIDNLGVKGGSDEIIVNCNTPNFNKHVDTSNLNESKVQGIGGKHISNTSCPLFRRESINSDVSMKKSMNCDLKDKYYSRIDENSFSGKGSTCGSGRSIKVRIDLTKIQHFIDNEPQLFTTHRNRKSKCLKEHVTKSSQSCHNADSDKRSFFSKIQTSQGVQNSDNSKRRKTCKYNSELFEENATG